MIKGKEKVSKMIAASKRHLWVLLAMLLAACSPATTTAIPTGVDINKVSTQTAATVLVTPTTATRPTVTNTITALPTGIQSTSIPASLPLFPLDGYVMVFTKGGDLYFRDGSSSPVKLTHGGELPLYPHISDDNQKIVFSRGKPSDEDFSNIYSVNSDGSQEQALITQQWLTNRGEGTRVRFHPVFVPNTHKLLFNTYLCVSQGPDSPCSVGIFLIDADSGKIKEILAPGPANLHDYVREFNLSPDGKMISIATIGHIDILGITGSDVRHNILAYKPSTSRAQFPAQFWLPDSSGLIVALPNTIYHSTAYGDLPAYTLWRYTIDNQKAVHIPLDAPLMNLEFSMDRFQVSLDGNWILYGGNSDNETSAYLGNLANGKAQLLGDLRPPYFSWSPDSKHFLSGNFLGAIEKPLFPINGFGLSWIDANHYIYISLDKKPKTRIGELGGNTTRLYELGFDKDVDDSLSIKRK